MGRALVHAGILLSTRRYTVGDSLIRTILKDLRGQFPLIHAIDRVVPAHVHQWAFESGVFEGREQVIRYLADMGGEKMPSNPEPDNPETTDVFSAQDRGSADTYARTGRGGSPRPGGQGSG